MSNFISAENMRVVLGELERLVRDGDVGLLRAVESGQPPVRQVVYNAMVDMARDPAYADMSLVDLNAVAIEIVLDFFNRIAMQRSETMATQQMQTAPAKFVPDPGPRPTDAIGVHKTPDMIATLPRPPTLAPPKPSTRGGAGAGGSVVRCLSIDSHDRDPRLFPTRYAFTCDLAEPLRLVQSATARGVVLPVVQQTINCPFLLLVIDELPSAYSHNASHVVRRAFSKLIPKSQYSSNGGRVYTVLEPIANDRRTFDPPIPAISRLSVSLLRPDGDLVSSARDDLTVTAIELGSGDGGPGGAATYTLILNTAFETREFRDGDIAILRGCSTGNIAFDAYVNRSSGHVVLAVVGEEPASAIGRTTVVIRHAGSMGAHGLWDPAPGADDVFAPGDGRLDLTAAPIEITNASVQISITLETECSHETIQAAEPVPSGADSVPAAEEVGAMPQSTARGV